MKASIEHLGGLLEGIPADDMPSDLSDFWKSVAWELSQCIKYATNAVDPQIVFNKWRKAGNQYIWEFYVNDLNIPVAGEYNWHGQNTSQWRYAGCVLVQDGRVSTHH